MRFYRVKFKSVGKSEVKNTVDI